MKVVFGFCLILLVSSSCIGQPKATAADSSKQCMEVMKELSYYWKLDSLANNGLRYYTQQKLLACNFSKLSIDSVFLLLGRPNETFNTNKGQVYYYYYFDIRAMPEHYDAPGACLYLNFRVRPGEKTVFEIGAGDIDVLNPRRRSTGNSRNR